MHQQRPRDTVTTEPLNPVLFARLRWLPWLPSCAWLRGLRRLLRTLGTVPLVLSSTTSRMNDKI